MARFDKVIRKEVPVIPWERCIAKTDDNGRPGLSVFEHSRIVGEVARALIPRLPPRIQRAIAGLSPVSLAALHDVGKVSPGFQAKILGENLREYCPTLSDYPEGFETNHAEISEAAINAYLEARFETASIAAILGIHHGLRDRALLDDRAGKYGGIKWAEERSKLIERLISLFSPPEPLVPPEAVDLLAGLVCVSDWIGSDEDFFPVNGLPPESDIARRAEQAIEACGFRRFPVVPDLAFAHIFDGYNPYPLQVEFIDSVDKSGLYILEAPTGTGKTEAALYAAYKLMANGENQGLFFGLPTRLTSNKIHERVTPFIEAITGPGSGVKLAHSTAWLRAFKAGGEALKTGNSWFDPRKRTLLYPFSVGTIDQALLSILRVKHFFVRAFGLAGKVVILDEVHSYDVYTSTLLEELVKRLLSAGCTVIVLSATLTRGRRNSLLTTAPIADSNRADPFPSITFQVKDEPVRLLAAAPPDKKKTYVRIKDWGDRDVAQAAIEHASKGQCVLCIANTIDRAQTWYNSVRAEMPAGSFDVGLLHSRFPDWRRDQLEECWVRNLGKEGSRPPGCVLVSTQVIEQSVDVDSDCIVSDLAPTDMLIQRMGRLWRHSRPDRPAKRAEFFVVTADLDEPQSKPALLEAMGKSARVYAPYILYRTYQLFKDLEIVTSPRDVRGLLEGTYGGSTSDPPFVQELLQHLERRSEWLSRLALSARSDVEGLSTKEDDERVATRYSDFPTLDALLVRRLEALGNQASFTLSDGQSVEVHVGRRNYWVTAQLYRNLVSLPRYLLGQCKTPPYLRNHFYGLVPVLEIDEDGTLLLEGGPTNPSLRYDIERGVTIVRSPDSSSFSYGSEAFDKDEPDWEIFDEFDW